MTSAYTARNIIKKSMQKLGILVKDEEPDADEANDALDMLVDMIDSWSNDSSLIYVRNRETFPLVAGVSTYTIGPSQTFNTIRPMQIIGAHVRIAPNFDSPVTTITDEVYSESIYDKTSQGIPQYINYDNGYPTGTIRLWPVPVTNYNLFLLTEKELTSPITLDTLLVFPKGWVRALIYNLAIDLAGDYGQDVPQAVITVASQSKGAIQRAVLKNRSFDAQPSQGGGRRRNVYSGTV